MSTTRTYQWSKPPDWRKSWRARIEDPAGDGSLNVELEYGGDGYVARLRSAAIPFRSIAYKYLCHRDQGESRARTLAEEFYEHHRRVNPC